MLSFFVAMRVPSGLLKAIVEIPVFVGASDEPDEIVGNVVGCWTCE